GAEPAHALLALLASATPAGRAASQETCLSASLPTASGTRGAVRSTAANWPARATPCPLFEARGFSMRLRALFLLLWAASAAAQPAGSPPADSTFREVTVTAARVTVATHAAPARVTVLDREDIDNTGARTVADALEARSAVFLKRYGPGGLASLSLRGTGASQTLVLLDGHRIADPQLGQLDLGLLPVAVVSSVEVAHGAASALHGTDGVGGVVHLRTPVPDGQRGRLDVRTGAFGERGFDLLVSDGRPGLSAVVAASVDTSEGDYLYTDSTRFDRETRTLGVTGPRLNADVRRTALFGRIQAEGALGKTAAGVLATDAERGLFAFSGAGRARQEDRALRLWADHDARLGAWRLRAGGLAQASALRYQNPAGGLDDTGRTRAASLRAEAGRVVRLGPALTDVTVGAEIRGARARHPSLTSDATETAGALFTSLVAEIGPLGLFPALRLDRVATPTGEALTALSPSAGLNVRLLPGLRAKASAGRAFRAPTFNDRFWMPGGDPSLRPERGWTADAGVSLDLATGPLALRAEASVFASRLRDRIVWQPGSFEDGFYWAPTNVGSTQTRGVEVSGRARTALGGLGIETGALATWTDARDRTDPEASSFDQRLLYVPDRLVRADAGISAFGVRLDAGLEHTGTRATASDGSAELPPATVVDLGLQATLRAAGASGTLGIRLENALDAQYQIVRQYPMPPRHIRVRLTLTSL
ncbi:MAG: TonB-dependent receptor, partial [Bacteroidota bacterium]